MQFYEKHAIKIAVKAAAGRQVKVLE